MSDYEADNIKRKYHKYKHKFKQEHTCFILFCINKNSLFFYSNTSMRIYENYSINIFIN